MTINYQALGTRIKTIRKKKGISQSDLSEAISCSPPYVSYIESGKKHMGLDIFILIANELNVSADELLIDSLENTIAVSNHEFASLLADCNDYEKRVLMDIMHSVKDSLRANKCYYKHKGILCVDTQR